MSIFKDPKDEEKICNVLKAYVEEFGAAQTLIKIPASWKNQCVYDHLGEVKVECTTKNTVEVLVPNYGPHYVVQLV